MERIEQITEKIYHEGVERGRAEEARIIEEAQARAKAITDEAQARAAEIEAEAKKQAAELDHNTRAELALYASQAVNALKSEIASLIGEGITREAVREMTAQKDFLGQITVALAKSWAADQPLTIMTEKADELRTYFAQKAKDLLDKGVQIEKVSGKEALFTIKPADGSYKVQIGESELVEYFKDFLRPQLIQMLF